MSLHRQKHQRSNSASANTMTDTPGVSGRAGYAILITGFIARAQGGTTAASVLLTCSDGIAASFVLSAAGGPVGSIISVQLENPVLFTEGNGVNITVAGVADATSVGYTVEWEYVPIFDNFLG